MSDDKHSKTEKPTAKKLDEAKKKGVPHSRDLTSTVTLIAAMVALYTTGGFMFTTLKRTSGELLGSMGTFHLTEASVEHLLIKLFLVFLSVVMPFMLVVVISGLATTMVQVGFSMNSERITFKLDKLNPATNAKKLFNKDSLVEMLKAVLKIVIVGYMSYKIMRDEMDGLLFLADTDLAGSGGLQAPGLQAGHPHLRRAPDPGGAGPGLCQVAFHRQSENDQAGGQGRAQGV